MGWGTPQSCQCNHVQRLQRFSTHLGRGQPSRQVQAGRGKPGRPGLPGRVSCGPSWPLSTELREPQRHFPAKMGPALVPRWSRDGPAEGSKTWGNPTGVQKRLHHV